MGTIRIIKTPDGEAPLWVREAWVGLELPCILKKDESDQASGVLSKKPYEHRSGCWYVLQDLALDFLEIAHPKAAEWWYAQGFPHEDSAFTFNEDEAEYVEGLILVPITKQ